MHDKNGKPIKKGDKVIIEAVVRETYATDEFCNIQLGIGMDEEHAAHNVQAYVTLNAKQVEVVEKEL